MIWIVVALAILTGITLGFGVYVAAETQRQVVLMPSYFLRGYDRAIREKRLRRLNKSA